MLFQWLLKRGMTAPKVKKERAEKPVPTPSPVKPPRDAGEVYTLHVSIMPDDVESAEVISINVLLGDTVDNNQILLELETDKVILEMVSEQLSEVSAILVEVGQEVTPGTPLIELIAK